jgi:hypothetical protein
MRMSESGSLRLVGMFAALFALALDDAANAQIPLNVPDQCSPLVTVQKEACAASVIFQCVENFLVMDFDAGDLSQQTRYDDEWSMLEYQHFDEGDSVLKMTTIEGKTMSMKRLLADGTVETEGVVALTTGVIKDRRYSYAGSAALMGETEIIGGTHYRKARIKRDLTLAADVPGISFEIETLIDPARNLMIEGEWQREAFGGEPEFFRQKIREIRLEGEPGFLSIEPEFGCE